MESAVQTVGESPRVSVVIATYNRAPFLPETLEGVLRQTFKDYEVIVVDDGSTDDTRRIVESCGAKVRYVYQDNRGASAARNLGVRLARAPWIAIQDSDDVPLPDHLQTLYRYAESRPDCGLVFANGGYLGGPQHRRETIIPPRKSRRLARRGVAVDDLFEKSIIRLQASLIRKDCYEAVGGHDETLRICGDLDLFFRLLARFPAGYVDRVVFLYRRHPGNMTRNEELRLVENIRVLERLVSDFPETAAALGRRRIARRLAYRHYRLAKGRWRRHERAAASEALRRAISLRPYAMKYWLYLLLWAAAGR
ncbi:MAG TPA: glycosyltransferase [candidate division Zixibacteria bacterium]|nr:glycosyltransferase [candidate division Zixibacteria bacterium]